MNTTLTLVLKTMLQDYQDTGQLKFSVKTTRLCFELPRKARKYMVVLLLERLLADSAGAQDDIRSTRVCLGSMVSLSVSPRRRWRCPYQATDSWDHFNLLNAVLQGTKHVTARSAHLCNVNT